MKSNQTFNEGKIPLFQTKIFEFSNRGRSQTTLTDFWTFLNPLPPWLTALLNKICDFYLVTLTFGDPLPLLLSM